jgi:hypothetical protein
MTANIRHLRLSLGLAGLGLIAGSLQAQLFVYQSRDLVLNFSRAGSSDLEVNLGSVDYFQGLAGSSTVSLTDKYSISQQLLPTFGNLNSLTFSVLGAQRGTGADPANTSWVTLKRNDPTVETTAPSRYTVSKTGQIQSAITGLYGAGGATSGANIYAPSATSPSTDTALIIPTTGLAAANSYSVKYSQTGGVKSLLTAPGAENTTPSDFTSTAGAYIRSDLYQYLPGSAGTAATYLGYFTFSNDGGTSFTPVPEPGEYAAICGTALVGLAVWRRTRKAAGPSRNR